MIFVPSLFILALSTRPSFASTLDSPTGCGSHISPEQQASLKAQFQASTFDPIGTNFKSLSYQAQEEKSIDVYWHVLHENETYEGGYIQDDQIAEQINVLNDKLANFSLSFNLVNVSRTQSYEWFNYPREKDSDYRTAMWEALHVGGATDLNVYTLGFTFVPGLRGFSSFPFEFEGNSIGDGVQIRWTTLPGGALEDYNSGITLVHEVGHWLGLYHTFQTNCEEPGDEVDDTPLENLFERVPQGGGCPIGADTCPGNGTDPIHNFMTYTTDACRTEFTTGQIKRATEQIALYRNITF